MKPLVSILIPAHNAEEWIAESLQCVVAQTLQRKEIIVVDDGSPIQRWRLRESVSPIASAFSARKIKVPPRPETKTSLSAKVITSSVSTPMTFWLRTRLPGKWRCLIRAIANGPFFLRLGHGSCTATIE
jgi:cellulose synthase/poly-beta-1,6-N-acetylglucosamine synthase-like glycosyltransferase